jgi:2-haloacid dehalogenase
VTTRTPAEVRLVVLDVNETLFSLEPVAVRFARVGLGDRFSTWFARVLRDGFAAEAAGHPVTFEGLARDHLATLLAEVGHGTTLVDDLLDGFGEVTAHPDVAAGLQALQDAGVRVVTLTVGSAGITRGFLSREGLDHLVAEVHDAALVGHWKPAPGAYGAVLEAHGVRADEAAMVAVHPWDVMGAQRAGMVGVWLDRGDGRWPASYPRPDVTIASLADVVAALG